MTPREQWLAAAKIELNGKDPIDLLTKKWSGYSVKPYYDESDSHFPEGGFMKRTPIPFAGPNGWLNLPVISALNLKEANTLALNHMQQGSDGVIFRSTEITDPSELLKNIKPEFCFLGFASGSSSFNFFQNLATAIFPEQLNGAIFWEHEPNWLAIANIFKGYQYFKCFGIAIESEHSPEQIIQALKTTLRIVDWLTDYGFSAQSVFQQVSFSFQSTQNFFYDVAAMRALRLLVQRISMAYGVQQSTSFIRLVSNPGSMENYQPHGELLSSSFAALAGVMASADAITINTENPNSERHVRTARNIALLLKEESKLDKVIDPLAGSYFIESLTQTIVEKAWTNLTTE